MNTYADPARTAWLPWTVRLPAVLATLACLFLGTIGWFYAVLIASYGCGMNDGPPTSGCMGAGWWVVAAGLGQWVLVPLAIFLGRRGLDLPRHRCSYAIACWLVIPLAVGWFALCLSTASF